MEGERREGRKEEGRKGRGGHGALLAVTRTASTNTPPPALTAIGRIPVRGGGGSGQLLPLRTVPSRQLHAKEVLSSSEQFPVPQGLGKQGPSTHPCTTPPDPLKVTAAKSFEPDVGSVNWFTLISCRHPVKPPETLPPMVGLPPAKI